jgi:hypothetical protein
MTADVHFVQGGDGPVLIGAGDGMLACACGNVLIEGFDPARVLAIGIQCVQCSAVTTTEPLPEGRLPPRSAMVAAPWAEPRMTAMTVAADVSVIGQAEMARLQALFQPASPDNTYVVSHALLDQVATVFERCTGDRLPDGGTGSDDRFDGLREHALGWAVRHLRGQLQSGTWAGLEDAPTANAVTHVTGFMHFVATWSHNPLFAAMLQTVHDRGFSLHGLAPFAAAHCMTMLKNRVRFPEPLGYPGRIEDFSVPTGTNDLVDVQVEVFAGFEFPFGRPWDHAALRGAVTDSLAAVQGRINLRNPGMLVLSPGTALPGFDEALIEAVKASVHAFGRKNRGLMAVAPVVLRLQALRDPYSVRFGYGFFPIANRHYRGESLLQLGE